jgi:hypothetical protein
LQPSRSIVSSSSLRAFSRSSAVTVDLGPEVTADDLETQLPVDRPQHPVEHAEFLLRHPEQQRDVVHRGPACQAHEVELMVLQRKDRRQADRLLRRFRDLVGIKTKRLDRATLLLVVLGRIVDPEHEAPAAVEFGIRRDAAMSQGRAHGVEPCDEVDMVRRFGAALGPQPLSERCEAQHREAGLLQFGIERAALVGIGQPPVQQAIALELGLGSVEGVQPVCVLVHCPLLLVSAAAGCACQGRRSRRSASSLRAASTRSRVSRPSVIAS